MAKQRLRYDDKDRAHPPRTDQARGANAEHGPCLLLPLLRLDEARAEKHPDWSVGATYGSRVRGLSDMVSVQVSVSLPLFTRNRQDRGIAARCDRRITIEAGRVAAEERSA